MSVEIMSRVWKLSPQKGSNLLLLLALADNANDDGVCWPGLDYLHQKIRMSKRQTQRLLDKLESTGEIIKQGGGVGRGDRTYYYIVSGMEPQDKASLIAKLKKDDILSPKQEPSAKQAKVDIAMSRKVDILNVLGGHDHTQNDDNRIQPSLTINSATSSIASLPSDDLLGLDTSLQSKPLAKYQEAKATTRLSQQPSTTPLIASTEASLPVKPKRTPSRAKKSDAPKLVVPPETKNALAILCFGTPDAWNINSNAAAMMRVFKEIGVVPLEKLRTFYCNWREKDFRGQKNQRPRPHQVVEEWLTLTLAECDAIDLLTGVSAPAEKVMYIPVPIDLSFTPRQEGI